MIRLLTIAVLLAANVVATEAQRGQSSARSATAGAVHSTRAAGSRVAPTMNRPIAGTRQLPFHGVGRRIGIATLPIFWGWGVPVFYVDSGAPNVPLPDDGPTGGVQLDVTPWRSRVYVDGVLTGRVDDFNGYYHPLELVAGPHQITIVDEGYQPTVVDIVVAPGRTTTYRATLNEAAGR